MSAIILEILKEHPKRIFTQTDIIEEIKKKTGKTKSKSAVSQNITTLSNKNKILYEKGIGRTPAKISLGITDKEKPKPKPIEKPKPKPTKPKPIKPKSIEIQLSQAEKTLSDGLTEYNEASIEKEFPLLKLTKEEESSLEESLKIAKETVINQKEEITNLEVEIAFAKGINKRPFTFKEFSEYILSKSEISGSNSMKMGEIIYRKSSLKNIYLIILHLRDENQL